jgi:hypothetical protein
MKEKEKQKVCDKNMSFSDCELAILRMQVDQAQEKIAKRQVNTPEIKQMIVIVEDFLKKKNLVCYGGISINALLPEEDKIYNFDIELPDYDFFSSTALEDAKELADIYLKRGYTEVEARSGQHHGTYKVFVNYQGVADITSVPKELFNTIKDKAVRVNGILYTDPNFLRMSMYLELSHPAGDTTRWEKVMKRLTLINKHYPLDNNNCDHTDFQRGMVNEDSGEKIFDVVKNAFINQGVVFFGGFAISQYAQYMPKNVQTKLNKVADFDVLAHNPESTAEIVKERLKESGFNNVKIIKREPVGEIIPIHYEIRVGKDTVAFVYKPIACHSYNILKVKNQVIKIATIDTMLNFYLAFLYTNRPYYIDFTDRILCMAKFLFDVQQKNRLSQKGLLQRFSITCYGHQDSVEEMRAEKAKKFKELQDKRGTPEYEEYFLNYNPSSSKTNSNSNPNSNSNSKTNSKTNSNSKTRTNTHHYSKKTRKRKSSTPKSIFSIWGKKQRRRRTWKKKNIY